MSEETLKPDQPEQANGESERPPPRKTSITEHRLYKWLSSDFVRNIATIFAASCAGIGLLLGFVGIPRIFERVADSYKQEIEKTANEIKRSFEEEKQHARSDLKEWVEAAATDAVNRFNKERNKIDDIEDDSIKNKFANAGSIINVNEPAWSYAGKFNRKTGTLYPQLLNFKTIPKNGDVLTARLNTARRDAPPRRNKGIYVKGNIIGALNEDQALKVEEVVDNIPHLWERDTFLIWVKGVPIQQ
ncbi:MAG: hypothetical protein HQL44_10360 [Alphaproteobacteria bacterium]|nr:hypothetical protein [Alphaproteobacteria bacterium]